MYVYEKHSRKAISSYRNLKVPVIPSFFLRALQRLCSGHPMEGLSVARRPGITSDRGRSRGESRCSSTSTSTLQGERSETRDHDKVERGLRSDESSQSCPSPISISLSLCRPAPVVHLTYLFSLPPFLGHLCHYCVAAPGGQGRARLSHNCLAIVPKTPVGFLQMKKTSGINQIKSNPIKSPLQRKNQTLTDELQQLHLTLERPENDAVGCSMTTGTENFSVK